jgi:hypothetical protein
MLERLENREVMSASASLHAAALPMLGATAGAHTVHTAKIASAALTTDQLEKAVAGAGEFLHQLSESTRARHMAFGTAITADGQVNFTSPDGKVIESNGSCFDFVEESMQVAKAHLAFNPGPDNDYVWGTQVADLTPPSTGKLPSSAFKNIHVGDVMQDRNVALSDGSFNATQHSAIIVGVGQTGGVNNGQITILEQNSNHQNFVTTETIDLSLLSAGEVWIYQPVAA